MGTKLVQQYVELSLNDADGRRIQFLLVLVLTKDSILRMLNYQGH